MDNDKIVNIDINNKREVLSRFEFYTKLMAEAKKKEMEEKVNGI